MELDVQVPVINVGEELGTVVWQSSEGCKDKSKNWISGRCEATGSKGASLINSTFGADFGVGGLEVHPVLGGASVPPGEDGSEVRIPFLNAV